MILIGKIPDTDIEELNKRLLDYYGYMGEQPRFRIAWANDQRETVLTHYTDSGLQLLQPEYRELPKYPWINNKYVLEELVPVNNYTHFTVKLSYEVKWSFESKKRIPLVPIWDAVRFIVERLLSVRPGYVQYKDEELSEEARQAREDKLMEDLWGNETDVTDALHHKAAIVVPGSQL